MNSRQREIAQGRAVGLACVLVLALLLAPVALQAQSPTPLDGSFSTALALRRVNPADATRQRGQLFVLMPEQVGDPLPVTTSDQVLRVLGWGADGLLFLRAGESGLLDALRYDPAADTEMLVMGGLPVTDRYAFLPGSDTAARVLAWPGGTGAAFDALRVYAVADMTLLAAHDVSSAGLSGARLAGVVEDHATFYSPPASDRVMTLDLATGAFEAPLEALAAGESAGQVLDAEAAPGVPLALVGRVNAKDRPGIFTLEAGGSAVAHPLPDAAQRVTWQPDGAGAAVTTSVPGDFSGSTILLVGPDFGAVAGQFRAAYDSCAIFTPDSRWVLFVSPDGSELLAASLAAPDAPPRVLLSEQPVLDLCDAAWQPAGTGDAGPENAALDAGELLTGEITGEQPGVDVPLELAAGDSVTITLERTGGDLDPFLLLLGPDGRELARNDDAPQQVGDTPMNAQILNFSAPQSGTYTIRATRFFEAQGLTSGTFRLNVSAGEALPVVVAQAPTTTTPESDAADAAGAAGALPPGVPRVMVGDVLTGQIDDALVRVEYALDLLTGESVTVTLERSSGDLDPYLALRGPDGRELAFNDDADVPVGGIPLNAQIRGFRANQDGTYVITATRYGEEAGMSSGGYRLTISGGQAALPETALQIGLPVEGTITDAQPVYEYSLALDAGQTVTITLEALDAVLDPYLVLIDSSGQELAYNDDAAAQVGSSTYNAQLAGWTAPNTDVYIVRATRFLQVDGPTTGPFRLTVTSSQSGQGPVIAGVAAGAEVTIGSVVAGAITGEAYAVEYPIGLSAGETIAVTLERTSGDLDALVVIYDAEGGLLSYNDDAVIQVGSDPYNSQITGFTAPASGVYTIRATRLGLEDGETTGAFTLRVEPGQPVSVTAGGPLQVGGTGSGALSTTVFAVDYTLALGPEEPVTITMEALDPTLDPTLIVYDAEGNELAFNDDALVQVGESPYDAQIVGFVSRAGGTFTVRATHYLQEGGTSVGRFRVTVAAGTGAEPEQSTK
ncbi:MAG: PPC domain-containing protein [Anaerolineae bacterium]|nr:PPC domain-containing protein [Anaerolineae bacterium]